MSKQKQSIFQILGKAALNAVAEKVVDTASSILTAAGQKADELTQKLEEKKHSTHSTATDARSSSDSNENRVSTLLRIENGILISCRSKEKNIDIPDGVHTLKARAFRNNKNLECIELPASLVKIEAEAFEGCERLRNVTFRSVSELHDIEQ